MLKRLKPRQVIGLAAIMVFGGIMVMSLTQPGERAIMEQGLAGMPSTSVPTEIPALPPVTLPAFAAATSGTGGAGDKAISELSGVDYDNLGSQAAKDDLYCAGVLRAEFEAVKADAHPDRMSILLRDGQALDAAGIARLRSEKAIKDAGAGASVAWRDKAAKDHAANALRIPLAACTQRATALSDIVEAAGN